MKKYLTLILFVVLLAPLHAQEEEYVKKPFSFARQHFEFGFDAGAGFANDLFGFRDFFQKDILIDLNKIESDVGSDGFNMRADVLADFFINIMNLKIFGGSWNFGVYGEATGNVALNLPKSIFTLINKGNFNQRTFSGMISASGGVYAETAFKAVAKYSKLQIGVTPALFSPILYMPKSGINYHLDTNDGVYLKSDGEIVVYGNSLIIQNGEQNYGFDLSAYGQYSLFSFLDIGGRVSHIPLAPAVLNNRMRLVMEEVDFGLSGQQLMNGDDIQFPEVNFNEEYDTAKVKVIRPLRFDIYARLKPFGGSEILVFTPNAGFTIDFGAEDKFFNWGIEARLNLVNLFVPYVSINREEGVWRNHLGFAFNLRVFELDLEGTLQSQSFKGSFTMQGFAFKAGIRFGW